MGGCCSSPGEGNLDDERNQAMDIKRPKDPKKLTTSKKPKTQEASQEFTPMAPPEFGKIQLGYWKSRGTAHPIRYQLEYMGIEYEEVVYEQGDASTGYSNIQWTSVKETLGLQFPNLPYIIDGDVRLTDPSAIMIYLAQKYDQDLVGRSLSDKARVDIIHHMLKDIKKAVTGHCYVSDKREALKVICSRKMKPVVDYLGTNEYLIGNYLTYVDFIFLELCDLVNFITEGNFSHEFSQIADYIRRLKSLPAIREYIASDKYMEKPFNNPVAKINNI